MGGAVMKRCFTLEYWIDDSWYVGKLKEVPGVFSQGESLEELEENIRDVYQLMTEEGLSIDRPGLQTKEITVDVMWNEGILLGSCLVGVGCYLKRHGKNHDIYANPKNGKQAPVPRHSEIKESLCDLIRKQLGL